MGDLIHSGAFDSALLTAFSRPRATFAGVLARHEEILELLTTSDADLAAAQADADAHLATLPEPTKDDYKTESAKGVCPYSGPCPWCAAPSPTCR